MEVILLLLAVSFIGYVLLFSVYAAVAAAMIFVFGMAYGYWGMSMLMAPVLWILMGIGALVGFVCAIKNAGKALRTVYGKK